MKLFLIALLAAQNFGGGTPGTVVISADRTSLISGETMQLFAETRDSDGNPTANETLNWSSTEPSILSVDNNGVVTASRLGSAMISVNGRSKSSNLQMQVLPHHIEVRPGRSEMFVGDQLQLTATAFDINQNPLPNTRFDWSLSNAGGFFTRLGTISQEGLMRAAATGPVTVKASVRYFSISQREVDRYSGTAQVLIKSRKDFKLTPLLSSSPMQKTFRIRSTPWSKMASNDKGQIAFVGTLDGLTSALMLYDQSGISILASAGIPGPMPGSFVWDFAAPSINNLGDVVTRADVKGNSSGILLANRNGANFILIDGQSAGGIQGLSNFTTTRYSLNDNGEVLFTAGFQDTSGPAPSWNTGLFKYGASGIRLLATTADALPGAGKNFQFGYFGLDGKGVAYFAVTNYSDSTALYRTDGFGAPEKIAADGDALAGSTISSLNIQSGFGMTSSGVVGYGATLKDGNTVVVQYQPSYGLRFKRVNWINQVYTVGTDGDVYFSGGTAEGWAVFRWRADQLLTGLSATATVDGAAINSITDAFVSSAGELSVQISTTASSFAVVRAAGNTVLFKQDTPVSVTANLSFLSLVPGGHTGAPHFLTGGNTPSVYQWNSNMLSADYVLGNNVAVSSDSWWMTNAIRSSSGDLYTTGLSTIFHHSNGRAETVLQLPVTVNGITLQSIPGWYENSNSVAVNASGVVAFPVWADGHYVLCTSDHGRTTIAMQLGSVTPTLSPSGGTFSDWLPQVGSAVALDDKGRAMIGVSVRGGKSGLFVFENYQWRAAALLDSTQIDGQTVRQVSMLRSAGSNFYAQFTTTNYDWVIAQYDSGQNWKPLMRRGDLMSNGSTIYYLNTFDVNRSGDVGFVAQVNGGNVIGMYTVDGNYHVVHMTSEPTDAGDIFPYSRFSLNIQDDRSLYFTAIDVLDRNLLYLAQPLF